MYPLHRTCCPGQKTGRRGPYIHQKTFRGSRYVRCQWSRRAILQHGDSRRHLWCPICQQGDPWRTLFKWEQKEGVRSLRVFASISRGATVIDIEPGNQLSAGHNSRLRNITDQAHPRLVKYCVVQFKSCDIMAVGPEIYISMVIARFLNEEIGDICLHGH